MTDETIVAVYYTFEDAVFAVRDLAAAGVPLSAISQYAKGCPFTGNPNSAMESIREQCLRINLFGSKSQYVRDTIVCDRSLEEGPVTVTLKVPEQHLAEVMNILELHNPIDFDDQTLSYSVNQTMMTELTKWPDREC